MAAALTATAPAPLPLSLDRKTPLIYHAVQIPTLATLTYSHYTLNTPRNAAKETRVSPIQSRLLALPGELRQQIYTLLLTSPRYTPNKRADARFSPISTSPSSNTSSSATSTFFLTGKDPTDHRVYPAILSTCQQIHAEATHTLYASNTFTAHERLLDGLPYLTSRSRPLLHARPVSLIQHWRIHVRLDIDTIYTSAEVSRVFSGCASLEIEVSEAMWRAAGYGNLLKFRGVRGVRRVCVWGSVADGFARILEDRMKRPVEDEDDGEEDGLENEDVWNPWALAR